MTIAVEPLRTLDELAACERLQRRLFGERGSSSVLAVPALRSVAESGGLLLGARSRDSGPDLVGALVDLATTWDGFAALFSHLCCVAQEARGQGVGWALRAAERCRALDAGIDVVRAWLDPLRSQEAHLLCNRAGAIGTAYERNAFGELSDAANRGLATDRIHVEWWLRSPRTQARIDEGRPAAHGRVGLHQMVVATRTTATPAGWRVLAGAADAAEAAHVLVEIPVDVDAIRDGDPAEAKRWRLGTREVFERLLGSGYLLVGLVHEAGRSFQLFERADRAAVLGRD